MVVKRLSPQKLLSSQNIAVLGAAACAGGLFSDNTPHTTQREAARPRDAVVGGIGVSPRDVHELCRYRDSLQLSRMCPRQLRCVLCAACWQPSRSRAACGRLAASTLPQAARV